jgi:hypothetical protein
MEFVFHTLGAEAEEVDVLTLALGANGGHFLRIATVVAEHAAVASMECQRHRAVYALHALSAGTARDEG